jgi:hypothetical protein
VQDLDETIESQQKVNIDKFAHQRKELEKLKDTLSQDVMPTLSGCKLLEKEV